MPEDNEPASSLAADAGSVPNASASRAPEREYPRKWYRVSNYGGPIEEREFIRETEKQLVFRDFRGRETRDAKVTSYSAWYPERILAERAHAEIRQRQDSKAAEKRVRDAAPELLAALEAMITAELSGSGANMARARHKARDAISKARTTVEAGQ